MDRLTDSLTIGLLRELGRSRALASAEMSSVGTSSLPALKAFLRAEQFFRQSAWDSAFTYYERATTADSQFAIALSREGRALAWTPSASDSEPTERGRIGQTCSHAPRDSTGDLLRTTVCSSLSTG